jgi:ketosteroid isomerase-like protein
MPSGQSGTRRKGGRIAATIWAPVLSIAACFARDACFLTAGVTVIRGRAEIRDILAQLIAMRFEIEVEMRTVLRIGDTALISERWTTRLGGAEGPPLVQVSRSTPVMRQVDAGWKLLVAAPWGWR